MVFPDDSCDPLTAPKKVEILKNHTSDPSQPVGDSLHAIEFPQNSNTTDLPKVSLGGDVVYDGSDFLSYDKPVNNLVFCELQLVGARKKMRSTMKCKNYVQKKRAYKSLSKRPIYFRSLAFYRMPWRINPAAHGKLQRRVVHHWKIDRNACRRRSSVRIQWRHRLRCRHASSRVSCKKKEDLHQTSHACNNNRKKFKWKNSKMQALLKRVLQERSSSYIWKNKNISVDEHSPDITENCHHEPVNVDNKKQGCRNHTCSHCVQDKHKPMLRVNVSLRNAFFGRSHQDNHAIKRKPYMQRFLNSFLLKQQHFMSLIMMIQSVTNGDAELLLSPSYKASRRMKRFVLFRYMRLWRRKKKYLPYAEAQLRRLLHVLKQRKSTAEVKRLITKLTNLKKKLATSFCAVKRRKKRALTKVFHFRKKCVELGSTFHVIKRRGKKTYIEVHRYKNGRVLKNGYHSNVGVNSNDIGILKDYIVEKPEQNLLAPPPARGFENLEQREQSFRKLRSVRLPARTLAECGFYLNDRDILQCYSCNASHRIEEVLRCPAREALHRHWCPRCKIQSPPRKQLSYVEADGHVSDDIRDPPGQQSIYIPPGDTRQESYRLSTFEHFPVTSAISRKSLAKCGFYFTGFFDRVKCFACGRTVERWEEHDNPAHLKWHKESCPLPRGGECGNVPIASIFQRILGNSSTRPAPRNPGEEVVEQRDPVTGLVTRTVRYPSDLPARIRQSGGTFEIGPNGTVNIRSGPGPGTNRSPGLAGQAPVPNRQPPLQQPQQPPRQWRMANVISPDIRRFLTNLFLNRELDRLASFARWPTGRPNVAPANLAKAGFFYLGDMDRTQCFSCGGVLRNWTPDDNAEAEHRTHFPNCRFILGQDPRNVPVPLIPDAPDERERNYPCLYPANPHMRAEGARLETFDHRWPMGRTAATPAEISQAGFFYLGERDRVKCWYCNGGLQHWEYDDMPWIEHAKWFPNCQFLLSVKGQHFVYRHLSMSPHLARPIIAKQDGARIDPASGPGNAHEPPEDIPPNAVNVRQPSPPPMIIDPQEEMRKRRERVDRVMRNSDVVKSVLTMGFSEPIVRVLLQEKVDSGTEENENDIYGTVSGLLDDVMKREEETRQEEERRSNEAAAAPGPSVTMPSVPSIYSSMTTNSPFSSIGPTPGSGKYNVSLIGIGDEEDEDRDMYGIETTSGPSSFNSVTLPKQAEAGETTESLQEALNKIEEERMCKICFSRPADMVFVPCGHMCCCKECTQAIRQCPVCRMKIEKAIKTYLS